MLGTSSSEEESSSFDEDDDSSGEEDADSAARGLGSAGAGFVCGEHVECAACGALQVVWLQADVLQCVVRPMTSFDDANLNLRARIGRQPTKHACTQLL
jgi:hypothetical protein